MHYNTNTHTDSFGLSALANFSSGLTVVVWIVLTYSFIPLMLRRWVTQPTNSDGCFYQKKMKVLCPPVFLSHQLQDGYSNTNSSGGSQQCVSQPATPGGALPVPSPLSPSPASLSSYHGDDSDSISSPPWPLKTPSSPVRTRNFFIC